MIAPTGETDIFFIPQVIDKTLILNYNNGDNNNSAVSFGTGGGTDVGDQKPGPQDGQELDLQTLYKLPNAHNFYCPNCNSCITKVIILRDDGSSLLPMRFSSSGGTYQLPVSSNVQTEEQQRSGPSIVERGAGDGLEDNSGEEGGRVLCSNCFSFLVPIGKLFSYSSLVKLFF